ncbi:MAG: DUF2284 domain-containing protein [bacterium]
MNTGARIKFEVVPQDLDILTHRLKELGCREATTVRMEDLRFRESTRRKCEVPNCGSYGNTFQCPPYTPSREEAAACLPGAYEYGVIGVMYSPPAEMAVPRDGNVMKMMERAGSWSARISSIVSKVESRAHELGYYKAMGFNCGPCTWCGMWTRRWFDGFATGKDVAACALIRSGLCRKHRRSRPSAEPLGIDIAAWLRERGLITDELIFPEISFECAAECPFYALVLVG